MIENDGAARVSALQLALMAAPDRLDLLVALSAELAKLGRYQEAEAYGRRALAQQPTEPTAIRVIGGLLQLQGRHPEALEIADRAISIEPDCGEAWMARADTLANTGQHAQAARAYARAIPDPHCAFDAWLRMGKMERVLGRVDQALSAFEAALRLRPSSPEARYERGLLRLELGEFAAGWPDYDSRWLSERFLVARGQVPEALVPLLAKAPSAQDLAGKRILLIGDQGIGDQVMFASIIPDLARLAASVTCICDPRLLGLFSASFPDVSFLNPAGARVDSETVDVLVAMGSLGAAFRQQATDFPGAAYLAPRPEVRAGWEERLGPPRRRLRVGLSWRGGTPQSGQAARSMDLAELGPLLSIGDVEFVSLQYGDVAEEIAAATAGRPGVIRMFPASEITDFEALAGLIGCLDLVVSVQNATVHLAGSLGRPCLAMVGFNPEWRYGRRKDSMPWYGSVRLVRQPAPNDWPSVLAAVSAALAEL